MAKAGDIFEYFSPSSSDFDENWRCTDKYFGFKKGHMMVCLTKYIYVGMRAVHDIGGSGNGDIAGRQY